MSTHSNCLARLSPTREHRPPGATPGELDWLMRGRPRTCPHHRRRRQRASRPEREALRGSHGGQHGGYTQRKRRLRRDRRTRAGPGSRGLCPAVHGTGVGICSNLGPTVRTGGLQAWGNGATFRGRTPVGRHDARRLYGGERRLMIRPRPGESFQHVSRANGGIAGATNHRRWGGYISGWLAHGHGMCGAGL